VTVRLAQATPVTGGLELELLSVDDQNLPKGQSPAGRSPRRKAVRGKKKADKVKRKVARKRR
jgi:ribonuclease R